MSINGSDERSWTQAADALSDARGRREKLRAATPNERGRWEEAAESILRCDVPDETYRDVLGSAYLREPLALRNAGRSIKALRGLNPNQLFAFLPHHPIELTDSPEIRSVLPAAFDNFLLTMPDKRALRNSKYWVEVLFGS